MNLINSITYYVNMIGMVVIVTLLVAIGVMYYFLKVKKITAKVERLDTSCFRKQDSLSYVPFLDVVSKDGSLDSSGMIVFEENRFVGGISVRGFDYHSSSTADRIDAQVNSVQFFNVVEKPTSFRQTNKNVDLSHNMAEHEQIAKSLAKELLVLNAEYEETVIVAEDYVDEPEVYADYAKRLETLKKQIFSKKHQLEEVKVLMEYMQVLCGDVGNMEETIGQRTSQIMFSYVYNPSDYLKQLSKEEIYVKAMEALDAISESYGEALAAGHFRSKRLTAKELIGLMRKHTAPLTGESLDINELLNSSYTSLFVSSDSLVEECKKQIGEEAYMEQLLEYQERLREMLRLERTERNRKGELLKKRAFEEAGMKWQEEQMEGESYGNIIASY